jgi:hypothetical protein
LKKFIFVLVVILFLGCGSSDNPIITSKDNNKSTNVKKDIVKDIELPVLDNQSINFTHNESSSFMLNDDFSGDFVITKRPDHGTLDGDLPNLSYISDGEFEGTDTLKYKIVTNFGDSNEATISFHFLKRDYLKDKTWIIKPSGDNPKIVLHDNTPSGAYYNFENEDGKKVLSLYGSGIKNSFHIIGYEADRKYHWNDFPSHQDRFVLNWDGKFSDEFIIYVVLLFTTYDGERKFLDIVYTPTSNGYTNYTDGFLHVSLGSEAKDGDWHHYRRNILSDLRKFYPGANISGTGYVNGIAIRGTGKVSSLSLSR